MTTELITRETALEKFTNEELDLIKATVAKDATDAELKLFLYTAAIRGLNPLTRQIHFVKRRVKQGDGWKEQGTIQTGIDGFRLIAERTGKYVPGSKPTIFEYDKGSLNKATVFGIKVMGGQAFEFSATAKFSEYAQYFNGQLGTMWKKMPETMLEKCAESKLLRRGFPEELSGLYTHEEMAQADSSFTIHEAEMPEPSQVREGETQAEPQIDSDNPYHHFLELCPEHGAPWFVNKFGKRCHKVGNEWCNLNEQIKPILQARCEKVGFTAAQLNDWCKENYDGKTWSKLAEEEWIDILYRLEQMNEPKPVSPLVEEAVKLGGVVTE